MITLDDFTLLPLGAVAPLEGEIENCPVCGRRGVVKRPEKGAAYCLHAEESEILGDGMRTEPTDCCDLAP